MSYPGLTNHVVKIPGSTVTAYLGEWTDGVKKGQWDYSLWAHGECAEHEDDLIATGFFDLPDLPEYVTPEQIACIAFELNSETL